MKPKTITLIIIIAIVIIAIYSLQQTRVTPTATTPQQPEFKDGFQKAPELTGIQGYLNTEDITIASQQGNVILIDFWTYTCINCIRTLPHLTEWDRKYRDQGLTIIGVHTPEFEFEKKKENVQLAIDKYSIEYPVVQDNNYATWNAFSNRYWPHKYLIDKDGYIRYDHIGEGKYQDTEKVIQELLKERNEDMQETPLSTIKDITPTRRQTQELYAGYKFALSRGQNLGNEQRMQPDKTVTYSIPTSLFADTIYLGGTWKSQPDGLSTTTESNSIVALAFTAASANIVAESKTPTKLILTINGQSATQEQAGTDVLFDNGESVIVVDKPRLYNIIDGDYGQYTLALSTTTKDFSFNAFTFGS
jgi:thiol-disulfide isomerase/thioredoxin